MLRLMAQRPSLKEALGRLWYSVKEGLVDVALIALCKEQVAAVLVERGILAPAPWQVRVGEVMATNTDKVDVVVLEGLNGNFSLVAACKPVTTLD